MSFGQILGPSGFVCFFGMKGPLLSFLKDFWGVYQVRVGLFMLWSLRPNKMNYRGKEWQRVKQTFIDSQGVDILEKGRSSRYLLVIRDVWVPKPGRLWDVMGIQYTTSVVSHLLMPARTEPFHTVGSFYPVFKRPG